MCCSQLHCLRNFSFLFEKLLSLPFVLYLSSTELLKPQVYKLDIFNRIIICLLLMTNTSITMYTHQMQKIVQKMKNLQKIMEVSYDTLFELEDCIKGADQ